MKTRKELAHELGISESTLRRWLKSERIELPRGRYLKPSEYQLIKEKLGVVYQPLS